MTMNYFRIGGDLLHLASILMLLAKIRSQKSANGISLKSQEMFALVFLLRYLDLFSTSSIYNIIMKIIYLCSSFATVYLIRYKFKATYDKEHDTFRTLFLIAPSLVLGFLTSEEWTILEILWTVSLYLESVSILPQLFLLQRTGEVESLTSHYIFALGGYRALYLLNWIWQVFTHVGHRPWVVWITGLVQTGLYCDFFYYYVMSKWYGKKLTLPQ
eukprot:TRINITY_DN2782_c0_g1_i1.p1 TRINITY_DN2782_c0_g1~~TRINITY_DN2782_c0_g1_i1.p1  ORF type:complete len:215 (+),score=27.43 TRINITY_DN2782_c0_g1_i1:176-820(+)